MKHRRLLMPAMAVMLSVGMAPHAAAADGGEITVTMGQGPDSLDANMASNSQSTQINWLINIGLVSFKHAEGTAGMELVPALAEALPAISADGKVYTFKLRPNLVYSDGSPVKASDFIHSVKRTINLKWGGKSYILPHVVGAKDFEDGKATEISGIVANDETGEIQITLYDAYGPFAAILALPGLGFVPPSTPMTPLKSAPGAGPYMMEASTDLSRGFSLLRNPQFAGLGIPDIPAGHLDRINFEVISNNQIAAQKVLNNEADVFDARDALPPALLPQIRAQAAGRYEEHGSNDVYYFWLNVEQPPFTDERVRRAFNMALDRRSLQRLSSGLLTPECYMLPSGFPGHPDEPCPFAEADWTPKLEEAKKLVAESGLAGTKVTVWGQQRSPRREWVEYAASVLGDLGFDATVNVLQDNIYYSTVGNAETKAQMGTASIEAKFPSPAAIYFMISESSIFPKNNYNLSNARDPVLTSEMNRLKPIPISEPEALSSWKKLDYDMSYKSYVATWGTLVMPQFYSERVDFEAATFHTIFGNDWTSIKLKQ